MTLDVPKLRTSGTYSLTGKVLNIEGLDSHGPYRNVLQVLYINIQKESDKCLKQKVLIVFMC